jgi:hypothetical protein
MTSILRYNGVDSEPQFLRDFNNYYHTYQGYSIQNKVILIPYSLENITGNTNFSAIKKFEFAYSSNLFAGQYIYAVRYNVLKFKNGGASVAFN